MTKKFDVIVVGGGHNGLVASYYLASTGLSVCVLERRHCLGGGANSEEIFSGFNVSTCAYALHVLQPRIIRDLRLIEHGLDIIPLEPASTHLFPDGSKVPFYLASATKTRAAISALSPSDGAGFDKWEAYWDRVAALVGKYAFDVTPPSLETLRSTARGTEDESLVDELIDGTLTGLLDRMFESDAVKVALGSQFHPLARTPDEPGVLLGCAALAVGRLIDPKYRGIPRGGMGAFVDSLARAARSVGVVIRCGAEVSQVLVSNGRAHGVQLSDGQVLQADRIIANCDLRRLSDLLPTDSDGASGGLDRPAGHDTFSTMKFHAAVSEVPDLSKWFGKDEIELTARVSLVPSLESFYGAYSAARDGRIPAHPLIVLQIPTVLDTSLAPSGQHIVSAWVRSVPWSPQVGNWDELRSQVGEQLIALITEYAPNFADSLIDWVLYTPKDIETRIGMTDGNIHHVSHVPGELLGDRGLGAGGYRTKIEGLYVCGASAHPGGEITGVPGHNSAQVVLEDAKSDPR
ncbi:NAD(P)/FAD-dependent oxidoreductase [Pseudarthrobacter sp. AB1]|uniref:phytoene desaturase family protein n=1 Tax=Pseudarthrobacter sp. AB1 TaxID=2138309 RepID=UPI00186B59B3|nr:NAD(P)/FAD-dependent oxidoreductase [Pseudarthrobacter sp. AB1]MBE4720411.1 hypothetical protein [Pseudarthrobacter sp. AB1]